MHGLIKSYPCIPSARRTASGTTPRHTGALYYSVKQSPGSAAIACSSFNRTDTNATIVSRRTSKRG
ncbi:hypothetical protein PVAP13_8KG325500 [Panicum virgatum]|uniref:Uncharacterized protein n=1 Tax=Panicum virgatum TaxID=38727 RepID=A0A8T0PQL9_PANVG|nr:hypothetical protein PVAP13_8KG325500 [Panicum virgatum]